MNIEVGQAFEYYGVFHDIAYGVILDVGNDDIVFVPVKNIPQDENPVGYFLLEQILSQ